MIMDMTKILSFILCLCYFDSSKALTEKIQLLACDSVERRIFAAHVTTGNVRGKLECYFSPQKTEAAFRIHVNQLNLKQSVRGCPTVRFVGYTTKMTLPETNEDWLHPSRRMLVPADPVPLAVFSCKNYSKAAGHVVEARKTGQKLMFEYETHNMNTDVTGDVNFVISSYVSGPSYNCPANTFRCWATRHVCIDGSLECDGIDNCYDNSDEDNFKCTGKIAGLLLPLFIVVMILVLLLFIAILIGIIVCIRRHKQRKEKLKRMQMDAMNYHNPTSPYYISGSQNLQRLPPETSNSRTRLA